MLDDPHEEGSEHKNVTQTSCDAASHLRNTCQQSLPAVGTSYHWRLITALLCGTVAYAKELPALRRETVREVSKARQMPASPLLLLLSHKQPCQMACPPLHTYSTLIIGNKQAETRTTLSRVSDLPVRHEFMGEGRSEKRRQRGTGECARPLPGFLSLDSCVAFCMVCYTSPIEYPLYPIECKVPSDNDGITDFGGHSSYMARWLAYSDCSANIWWLFLKMMLWGWVGLKYLFNENSKIPIIWGSEIPRQLLLTQEFIEITCHPTGNAQKAIHLCSDVHLCQRHCQVAGKAPQAQPQVR